MEIPGGSEWIAASVVVGATVKGWFTLRRHQIREQAENYRLTKALEDSTPQQRPAILRAYGQLRRPADDDPTRNDEETGE